MKKAGQGRTESTHACEQEELSKAGAQMLHREVEVKAGFRCWATGVRLKALTLSLEL